MNTSTTFLPAHRFLRVSQRIKGVAHHDPAQTKRASIRPLISPREQEVLYLIAFEHSSKEIAAKLYLSCETVNTHRKNIMVKFGVKNTAGMVRVAFEKNILHT